MFILVIPHYCWNNDYFYLNTTCFDAECGKQIKNLIY